MIASRVSLLGACTRSVSVVRPFDSANVAVFTVVPCSSVTPSGRPSYVSVETTRSFGTTSRYSPWKPTSVPSPVTITYLHAPPGRRSISATVISPRFACHQRLTSSGVVHASNTKCLGASNSRVIRICSSVGNVTVALLLSVTAVNSFDLPLLELFQYDVEPVEPLRPRALVARHPVVDGLEGGGVEAVEPPAPVFPHLDRPDLAEHAQMLRHLGLGEAEVADEVVHGALAARKGVEDLPPPRLCHRVERIRRGRRPCHTETSYTHMGICQA